MGGNLDAADGTARSAPNLMKVITCGRAHVMAKGQSYPAVPDEVQMLMRTAGRQLAALYLSLPHLSVRVSHVHL